jgi:O-antigen ligase
VSLLIIFPFWEWGRTQSIQTPIDHASRHNYFQDPLAPVLFFLPMYGPLMLMIPYAFSLAYRKKLIGLGVSLLILFLLGLGGTTPLPRLFFGKGWEWLTYDRFAFWASLLLLPFFGMIVILLRRKYSNQIRLKIFGTLAVFSVIVGSVTMFLPLQPGAVDMSQIVKFLKQDDRSQWRYLTFGFGDQLARLSTLTTATTMDGSYHTARTLPELRTSGIGQIDTAFWLPGGLTKLEPVLQRAGERGVRWGFVNIPQYIPILEKNGWIKLRTLKGGVQVWENPNAVPPERSKAPPMDWFASFAWGTFPLLSLVTTLSLASLKLYPVQAEKVLRGIYALLLSLIPLALCFWYYRIVGDFSHPRVYFTYDHALFFLSDTLALLTIILWATVKISHLPVIARHPLTNYGVRNHFLLFTFLLFTLTTLSILWSSDWRTSLYISLHLWLVFLLILSLKDWNEAWRPVMFGLCAALTIQIIVGYGNFALQSTSFLQPLNIKWPGIIDTGTTSASVVQLQNGLRILRAYGTLPHPNILGGFVLICLTGPIYLFVVNQRPNYAALLLLVLGIILLGLTFSRSAWLGLISFLAVLSMKSKHLDRKRLSLLLASCILTIILTLFPLRSFLLSRIGDPSIHTEQISTVGRSWLAQQAINTFREHSIAGVGVGSFILELSEHAVEGAPIEPVHNIFLLIGSELGILGLLLLAGLIVAVTQQTIRIRSPQAILASGTLAGLGMISLFDHYLWSIAPGRLMLGLALGLWAGQVSCHEA